MKASNKRITDSEQKRMILISLDAMGARDLAFMEALPNFKKIMDAGSICRNVSSVYPSLTYPAHVSIVTGRTPNHHGVINNTLLQPKLANPDWMWQRKFVKGTTLYDEAIKKGNRVAALLWPVTAKSKITYNLPEVLANRPWQNQIVVSACNGSALFEMELLKKFGYIRDGISQPALDNFVQASALHTLQKYRPNMMLIHFTDLDTNRHLYGLDHAEAKRAMMRHDERLGELLDMLEKTGNMDKTTVVVLGDHCQLDTKRVVYFNYLLKEHGFLKAKNGVVTEYEFIAKNCDGSCYIYDNKKKRVKPERFMELTNLLESCRTQEVFGIESIFSGEEAAKLGADGSCFCMIEAKKEVYYLDELEELTCEVDAIKKGKMVATHGYLPDKEDYQTFFMAMGYGIKKGGTTEHMNLFDEGPTLAKIWGLDLGDVDGRVVTEILSINE